MKNSELYTGFAFPKPVTIKKTPKPISRISEKKKQRLSKQWELDFFIEIAIERSRNWIVFAKDVWWIMKAIRLTDLKPSNFSHKFPKWKYPELRYEKNNIEIVTFAYHFEEHNWMKYCWPELPN